MMYEVNVVNVALFLTAAGLLARAFFALLVFLTPGFKYLRDDVETVLKHAQPQRRAARRKSFEERATRVWTIGGKP